VWIDGTIVRWVSDEGQRGEIEAHNAQLAVQTAEDAMAGMHAADRDNMATFTDYTDPTQAKALDALWESAAPVETDTPDTASALEALRSENHLCPNCLMREACTIGRAIVEAPLLLTTVSACLGFTQEEDASP